MITSEMHLSLWYMKAKVKPTKKMNIKHLKNKRIKNVEIHNTRNGYEQGTDR